MRRFPAWLAVPALLVSAAAAAGESYVIDSDASDVHWLVYRAGAFARFGHNHVISIPAVKGLIDVDPDDLARSTFEIEVPVTELVVDDPSLRRGLGDEFSSVPSEDDIAGTRRNMLSERVLNAEAHPLVRVTGKGPIARAGAQALDLELHLLGRVVPVTVPTTVTLTGDVLEAVGEFELTHEQLGMKPFSVMAGALQVGEKLSFTYRIRAHREAGAAAAAR